MTSSAASLITVCHRGKDLKVTANALAHHAKHGDSLGSCPVAVCPCFTSASLAKVAARCKTQVIGSCGSAYTFSMFCLPDGSGGQVVDLGYYEALKGGDICRTIIDGVTTSLPVTAAQLEGCSQAIVGNAYYPVSCPD